MLRTYNKVRQLRDELGLTQKEFAAKIREFEPRSRASQSSVCDWEDSNNLSEYIIILCNMFNITPSEFFANAEEAFILKSAKEAKKEGDRYDIGFLRYRNLKPKDRALVDDLMIRLHANS